MLGTRLWLKSCAGADRAITNCMKAARLSPPRRTKALWYRRGLLVQWLGPQSNIPQGPGLQQPKHVVSLHIPVVGYFPGSSSSEVSRICSRSPSLPVSGDFSWKNSLYTFLSPSDSEPLHSSPSIRKCSLPANTPAGVWAGPGQRAWGFPGRQTRCSPASWLQLCSGRWGRVRREGQERIGQNALSIRGGSENNSRPRCGC